HAQRALRGDLSARASCAGFSNLPEAAEAVTGFTRVFTSCAKAVAARDALLAKWRIASPFMAVGARELLVRALRSDGAPTRGTGFSVGQAHFMKHHTWPAPPQGLPPWGVDLDLFEPLETYLGRVLPTPRRRAPMELRTRVDDYVTSIQQVALAAGYV